MKPIELEIVLHTDYGGFRVNTEMALWLVENRKWTIINNYDYKKEYPENTLVDARIDATHDYYHVPNNRDETGEFRTSKDLIDCVRAIQEIHKNEKGYDRDYIHNLKIKIVRIKLDIEDYHDGKEKVIVSHCVE